jgi:hypothetical protein
MTLSINASEDVSGSAASTDTSGTTFSWSAGDKFAIDILITDGGSPAVFDITSTGVDISFDDCGHGGENTGNQWAYHWVGECTGDSSGTITIVLTETADRYSFHIVHLVASAGDVQVDAYNGLATNSSPFSYTITTTDSAPLIIAGWSHRVDVLTVGSGYTELYASSPHFSARHVTMYQQFASSGGQTVDATASTYRNLGAVGVAYYDDNTGGGPVAADPLAPLVRAYRNRAGAYLRM